MIKLTYKYQICNNLQKLIRNYNNEWQHFGVDRNKCVLVVVSIAKKVFLEFAYNFLNI